jgi:hypothetical protein
MQAERWRRLEHLYHAAMEEEEDQRAAFLEKSCVDDPSLQGEVESLIAYARQTGGIIDEPLEVIAAALDQDILPNDSDEIDRMIGRRIAQYRIVEQLGAGAGWSAFHLLCQPIQERAPDSGRSRPSEYCPFL